jgi:catalase
VATKTFDTSRSVLFDGVVLPGGDDVGVLAADERVLEFVRDAYRHKKTIGLAAGATAVLNAAVPAGSSTEGVVVASGAGDLAEQFLAALAQHRHWARPQDYRP